jgi:hypothetical protein
MKKLISAAPLGLKCGTHIRHINEERAVSNWSRGAEKITHLKLTFSILLCIICEFHKTLVTNVKRRVPAFEILALCITCSLSKQSFYIRKPKETIVLCRAILCVANKSKAL